MKSRAPRNRRQSGFMHATRHIRARPIFSTATLLFVTSAIALGAAQVKPEIALLIGFDVGALFFLGCTSYLFAHANTASMRERSRKLDEGRWGFLWSSVAVSTVVLVALASELHASKDGGLPEILLASSCLLLSWLFMNIIFAIHYAHEFYGGVESKNGGLDFPGTSTPDYWDFAYFAIVIGMTFQVSDVQISSRSIRRTALAHAIIAFFFNVIIIALTVNVVAGRA